jgi:hypothetical protein
MSTTRDKYLTDTPAVAYTRGRNSAVLAQTKAPPCPYEYNRRAGAPDRAL